jgi:predicted homoserine dehydrogenase-like protein
MSQEFESAWKTRLRIGVSGTGFISSQLARSIVSLDLHDLSCIYTRRPTSDVERFCGSLRVTNSLDEVVEASDVVVECSGDPLHAFNVVQKAHEAGRPVITMNAEFQVTCGSYFAATGYLTEAEGDQPGCLAALSEEAKMMGFRPIVYGNMKGFMDLNPTRDSMVEWSRRLGVSLSQVTSFTDGTKLQIEQALVANWFGADIAEDGMLGPDGADFTGAAAGLGAMALERNTTISDYVISRNLRPGVFLVATHQDSEKVHLKHYKLGDGPLYVLEKPYHLCALEIPKTIERVRNSRAPLMNNTDKPSINVAAVAKKDLKRGQVVEQGIGGFEVRGMSVAIKNHPRALPIGVVSRARIVNEVPQGAILTWDDVELPESFAVETTRKIFDPDANGGEPIGSERELPGAFHERRRAAERVAQRDEDAPQSARA